MKDLFSKWLAKRVKDDESNELYCWDIFYRYEGAIALTIGTLIAFVVVLIYGPVAKTLNPAFSFSYIYSKLFAGAIAGSIFSCVMVGLIRWPFFYTKNINGKYVKRDDIGQARFAFVTYLSYIGLIVLLYAIIRLFYAMKSMSLMTGILYAIICIVLVIQIFPNITSYVNWRYNWAIKNYESVLLSRHDKYWASYGDIEVDKKNMQYFREYKKILAIILLVGPTVLGFCFEATRTPKTNNNSVTTVNVAAQKHSDVSAINGEKNTINDLKKK